MMGQANHYDTGECGSPGTSPEHCVPPMPGQHRTPPAAGLVTARYPCAARCWLRPGIAESPQMTVRMHPPHDLGGSANVATATQAKTQNGTFATWPGGGGELRKRTIP